METEMKWIVAGVALWTIFFWAIAADAAVCRTVIVQGSPVRVCDIPKPNFTRHHSDLNLERRYGDFCWHVGPIGGCQRDDQDRRREWCWRNPWDWRCQNNPWRAPQRYGDPGGKPHWCNIFTMLDPRCRR